MALQLRVTLADFILDVLGATDGAVDALIDGLGFLGEWNNPTHVVVAIGSEFWIISVDELEAHTESWLREGSDVVNWEDAKPHKLYFSYRGSDQKFLDALIRIWGIPNPKPKGDDEHDPADDD